MPALKGSDLECLSHHMHKDMHKDMHEDMHEDMHSSA